MLREVLEFLGLENALLHTQTKKIIDATLGAGGYTLAFCEKGASVLAIEADDQMLQVARERLRKADCDAKLVKGNFSDIKQLALDNGFNEVDAVVFDLGVASEQLTSGSRGFSFQNPSAKLDMRINPNDQGVTASDLLNSLDTGSLIKLFKAVISWGETKKLVEVVVEVRDIKKFETVGDFLEVLDRVYKRRGRIHPATKPFLALRIAVNQELINLEKSLKESIELLKHGGNVVVVSFHSGEDRIVKKKFLDFEKSGLGRVVTKKPVLPTSEEVEKNSRARSAKLRVFEKVEYVQKV